MERQKEQTQPKHRKKIDTRSQTTHTARLVTRTTAPTGRPNPNHHHNQTNKSSCTHPCVFIWSTERIKSEAYKTRKRQHQELANLHHSAEGDNRHTKDTNHMSYGTT